MQGIRHHKESFFHTRFWIVVLAVICIILGASVVKITKKYIHAKSIRDDYQQELEQVIKHQADLQKNITALSTERGKEEEIRDRYRVVKEGEQMILIVNNDDTDKQLEAESKSSLWVKIRAWFKRSGD